MKKKYGIRILLGLGIIFLAGIIFFEPILTALSQAFVYEDPLVKAEAIVVLSGSTTGNRVRAAARLYHSGFGEKLVFSGFEVYPGTYTSTLMERYALELGVPKNKIITWIPDAEVSTQGESIANLELLHKSGIRKFILVTSAFHTRRAKSIYEKAVAVLGYDIEFLVYPAQDPLVPIQGWWKLRTGQKGIFFECVKSIAYYFNL